jgi:hypothetical protein
MSKSKKKPQKLSANEQAGGHLSGPTASYTYVSKNLKTVSRTISYSEELSN